MRTVRLVVLAILTVALVGTTTITKTSTGPAGPAGPVGPAGPSGADGAPGVPGYSPNTLLSGGGVFWTGGLTFSVGSTTYLINNTEYTSPATTVTLAAADPTNPRIDIIAVDSTGSVVVIPGTAATPPAAPDVDPATQLQLTFAFVAANALVPSNVSTTDIYHENAEWTASKSGAPINLASTSNPHSGTVDIEATAATTGNYAQMEAPAPFDLATQTNLVFYIRSKAAWPSTRSLQIWWQNGNTKKGSTVVLNQSAFTFDSGITGSYQQIVIPLSLFAANGLLVNRLRFTVAGSGGTIGWYLDDITMQVGITPPTAPAGLTLSRAWNATTTYSVNEVVTYATATWVAILPNTNSAPTDLNPNWFKLAVLACAPSGYAKENLVTPAETAPAATYAQTLGIDGGTLNAISEFSNGRRLQITGVHN